MSTSTTTKPITLNTKIGDVLKAHPELLEVLLAQSPHFSRLKNPILRRVHGSLVNVGQAATIAGLDPVTLVRTLNAAIGQVADEVAPMMPTSKAGGPEPVWLKTATVATKLDVREDQRKHADPFNRIMDALSKVQDGQVLLLRNTFEPLPLYDVTAKRGYIAWARKLAADDWEIFFLKVGKGESAEEIAGASHQTKREDDESFQSNDESGLGTPVATVTIDVRELTPPQPMMKILDALANLKAGETLLVHHQRRPVHLYAKLAELGYTQRTIERGPEQVDIYIRKG